MPEACMGGEGRGSMEKMSGRPPLCHTRGATPQDHTHVTGRTPPSTQPGLAFPRILAWSALRRGHRAG